MSNIAVVNWSGTGNTEAMANLVAEGARSEGKEVDMITADRFGPSDVERYDRIAFGCPSMGDEVLEEDVFEPMFSSIEGSLSGKRIGLFGSYGWGDGEWMRNWTERCRGLGADLVGEGVIANEYPDDAEAEECRNLGKAITH